MWPELAGTFRTIKQQPPPPKQKTEGLREVVPKHFPKENKKPKPKIKTNKNKTKKNK